MAKINIRGRVISYPEDNVSTEVILPSMYLAQFLSLEELGQHAMELVDPDFPRKVKAGDIMVVGANFGCGTSVEEAVTCLKVNGIAAIIAESFARLMYRNAIDNGLPALECPGITAFTASGDLIEVDFESGEVRNLTTGKTLCGVPMPRKLGDILAAGGILPYTKRVLSPGSLA